MNDITRGVPILDEKVRATKVRRQSKQGQSKNSKVGLESAYCAEVVAMTYENMGLLATDKQPNWFDPGKFWSGDTLPMAPGYALGTEIAVELGSGGR
jgi:hypothetical protein